MRSTWARMRTPQRRRRRRLHQHHWRHQHSLLSKHPSHPTSQRPTRPRRRRRSPIARIDWWLMVSRTSKHPVQSQARVDRPDRPASRLRRGCRRDASRDDPSGARPHNPALDGAAASDAHSAAAAHDADEQATLWEAPHRQHPRRSRTRTRERCAHSGAPTPAAPSRQIPTCGTPARDKPRPVQQGLNMEWQRTVPAGAPVASNATALGLSHASSASSVVASMAAAQSGATGACGCASESQMTHSCTEQTQSAQVLQTSAAQHVQRREGGALQHSSLEHAYASMASVSSSMTTPLTTSMAGGGGVRLQRAAAVAPEGAVSLNAFFPPQHVMPDMPMGRRFPSRLGVAASDAAKGAANVATTTAAPAVESPSAREAARIDGMTERVSQRRGSRRQRSQKMKQTLNAFHVSFTRLGDDALLTGWRPDFEHSLAQLCDEVEARGGTSARSTRSRATTRTPPTRRWARPRCHASTTIPTRMRMD